MTHVHFIGIGGTGLSAIARLLLEKGEVVSGSDRQMSTLAQALQASGARVTIGHAPENIQGATIVVRSSAIPDENVEVQAARAAGIPVLKRAEFLGWITKDLQLIAVAGTHGKTTTTAMIAWMLTALGKDPSYIIGSVAANLGNNAHSGKSALFVIEADEYDHMFLGLSPAMAVVTNIEHDHPDCYPTPEDFWQAFSKFSGRIIRGGTLLVCSDDPGARRLLQSFPRSGCEARSYGFNRWLGLPGPDYYALDLTPNQLGGYTFGAFSSGKQDGGKSELARIALQVPGRHNASNALASIAVADLLGLPLEDVAQTLGEFQGSGRRFELRGEVNGIAVIDDYAHHPTEIRATLAAARARYPGHRILATWQPHTYSRTRVLFDEFASAFDDADLILITEIYAARENPPADGFSSRQFLKVIPRKEVYFTPGLPQAVDLLLTRLLQGDVLLVLSAGDADWISTQILERLKVMAQTTSRSTGND